MRFQPSDQDALSQRQPRAKAFVAAVDDTTSSAMSFRLDFSARVSLWSVASELKRVYEIFNSSTKTRFCMQQTVGRISDATGQTFRRR